MRDRQGWAMMAAITWWAATVCAAHGQAFPSAEVDPGQQFYLAELQPELNSQPPGSMDPPARPPRPQPPRASFNLLAGAPNMFGDFFEGGTGILGFTPPPVVVQSVWTDGNPIDLFVTNPGGPGAGNNPAAPIQIFQGPGGQLISMSIGNGIDTNGNGQPDTYPVSEPVGSSPGTGFVYDGGNAIFVPTPGNPNSVGSADDWSLEFSHTQTFAPVAVRIPAGGGASVRRIKLAENNSPQPRDRVFFNYNFFNDVIGGYGDVNRYSFGVEKTFHCGQSSLELRAPFAATLASAQVANGSQLRDTELGNAALIYKRVLYQCDCGLIAGGVGMTLPLSDTTTVSLPGGQQVLRWESDSIHVLPYFALLSTPNEDWFWQAFWQFDIDTNGNVVAGDPDGAGLQRLGVMQDATLMFVDVGAGHRIYNNPCASGIQSAHAIAELHYSTTLQDADFVTRDGMTVGMLTSRFDVLNLTLGVSLLTHNNISIRPALVVPLRDDHDQQFDYEAAVQINVRL